MLCLYVCFTLKKLNETHFHTNVASNLLVVTLEWKVVQILTFMFTVAEPITASVWPQLSGATWGRRLRPYYPHMQSLAHNLMIWEELEAFRCKTQLKKQTYMTTIQHRVYQPSLKLIHHDHGCCYSCVAAVFSTTSDVMALMHLSA